LHPTIAWLGEVLPDGFSHSNVGFLLNNKVKVVKVNQTTIRWKMEYLQKHAIVAYFVGRSYGAMDIKSPLSKQLLGIGWG